MYKRIKDSLWAAIIVTFITIVCFLYARALLIEKNPQSVLQSGIVFTLGFMGVLSSLIMFGHVISDMVKYKRNSRHNNAINNLTKDD